MNEELIPLLVRDVKLSRIKVVPIQCYRYSLSLIGGNGLLFLQTHEEVVLANDLLDVLLLLPLFSFILQCLN